MFTHGENLILLNNNDGNASVPANLFERMQQATIRSVDDPTGSLGKARAEVITKNTGTSAFVYRNLLIGSTRDNLTLDLNHPTSSRFAGAPGALTLPSVLSNGQAFTSLNTLTISNNGAVTTPQVPEASNDSSPSLVDLWLVGRNSNNFGGGRISIIAKGSVSNSNLLGTVGVESGGSINIVTNGNYTGAGVLETMGGVHGGSIIIKSTDGDISQNVGRSFEGSTLSSNGFLMGGTIRLEPIGYFRYLRTDNTSVSISANGLLQGGVIGIRTGEGSLMNPGSASGEPPMTSFQTVTADGTSPSLGRGGYVSVNVGTGKPNVHNVTVQANGGLKNGTVVFTSGD